MATSKASFSIASIIAIIMAILSFQTGAILGLLLAAGAFLFGVFGAVMALSPGTRGGILSVLAVIASVVGVVAAIVKAIMWFF